MASQGNFGAAPGPAGAAAAENESRWALFAVAGAMLFSLLREPLSSQYTLLLAEAFRSPTSLSRDLIVQAARSSVYTFAPRGIAHLWAGLSGFLGADPARLLSPLLLALWVLQAFLTFRCFRVLLSDVRAAALATLFAGLELPIFLSDYPYSMVKFERTIGVLPLLLSLTAVFEGRRWTALGWLWAAMYLHLHPALYVFPFVVAADGLQAWAEPPARAGAVARLLVSFVLALPFVVSVGSAAFPRTDLEFTRLTMVLNAHQMAGLGTPASDWVFRLESLALAALAALQTRHRPCARYLALAAGICACFLVAGRLAYAAWTPGARVAGLIVRMSPMNALCLPDFFGLPLFALWLTRQMEEGEAAWPVLTLILAQSWSHDFVLRLVAIAVGAGVAAGKRKWALLAAAAAALAPLLNALSPALLASVVRGIGLRGGLLRLPAFKPYAGVEVLAAVASGIWWRRRAAAAPARPVLGIAFAAVLLAVGGAPRFAARFAEERAKGDLVRMEDWIRENTPPEAVVVASPVPMIASCNDFMARSRRSLYACAGYLEGATVFGAAAAPMAGRLRAMGYDLSRKGRPYQGADYLNDQSIPNLTPRRAGELTRALGAPGYLLTTKPARDSGTPLHEEGALSLYAAS